MSEIDEGREECANKGNNNGAVIVRRSIAQVGKFIIAFCIFLLFVQIVAILRDGIDMITLMFLLATLFVTMLGIAVVKVFGKNLPENNEQQKRKRLGDGLCAAGKLLIRISIFWIIVTPLVLIFVAEPLHELGHMDAGDYQKPTVMEMASEVLLGISPFLIGLVAGIIMIAEGKKRLKAADLLEAKIESMEEVEAAKKPEPEVKKDLPPMLNADPDAAEAPVGAVEHKIITSNNSEKL